MAKEGNSTEKLTVHQRRAIVALLSSPDVKTAAQVAKVGERSLHRWLKTDAEFNLALREAEGEAIEHVTRQLVRLADNATQTLEDTMNGDASAGVKLRAADIVLTNLLRLRELATLEARILALENAQKLGEDESKNA